MRKVHKERLIGACGIVLIILSMLLFISWEKYGREALTYDSVIVFKQDVQKGTIVTKKQLGIMRIEKNSMIEGAIQDPELIIGKRTNSFIPRAAQLCAEYFTNPELVTGEGKNVFSIPMDWIYAFPQTLRRGDRVHFYTVYGELLEESYYEIEYEQLENLISSGSDKPIVSVNVAYVKDSGNREVVDVTADRMDASAVITDIEVVISESDYQELKNAAESGMQFVIMYE
ncbi:MAG: hypothetical protein ACI4LO_08005 [Anaerovoracaceae bacterium]